MTDYNINAVKRRTVQSGSAGLGPYNFTFEILSQTDIAVHLNTTLLTLTSDYTVSINSNGTGSVTIVTGTNVSSTPQASDDITIIGARDIERTTDFVTAGDLTASSLNEQLDSLTIFDQQISERVDRALIGSISDPTTLDMTLPTVDNRKGKYLAFNSTSGAPEAGPSTSNVNSLASITDDIDALGPISANITTVAGQVTPTNNISTVAGAATNINLVGGSISNVNTVATNISAIGTASANATLAENYATKTDGTVETSPDRYSAEAHAVGGTGVTSVIGSAREWAIGGGSTPNSTQAVDSAGEFSAKGYAISNITGGSAKNWALGGGSGFSSNTPVTGSGSSAKYSAQYWAEQAAARKTEFSNIYHGISSSAPTGSEVGAGDLWFDSSANILKYYNNSNQWVAIESGTTAGFSISMAIAL